MICVVLFFIDIGMCDFLYFSTCIILLTCTSHVVCSRVQFTNETLRGSDQSQMTAKFVKDTSKYWYKPHLAREEGELSITYIIINIYVLHCSFTALLATM